MRSVGSAIVLVLGLVLCGVGVADSQTVSSRGPMSSTAVETQAALRDLWMGRFSGTQVVMQGSKNSRRLS